MTTTQPEPVFVSLRRRGSKLTGNNADVSVNINYIQKIEEIPDGLPIVGEKQKVFTRITLLHQEYIEVDHDIRTALGFVTA
jgi:hypothetical protein